MVALGICAAWTAADLVGDRRGRPAGDPRRGDTAGDRRGRLLAAALYVAPLSFFVYVAQEPALSICKNLAERAAGSVPALVLYIVPPLVVVAAAVLTGLALRRLAPRAFAVVTGGRVPEPAAQVPASGAAAVAHGAVPIPEAPEQQ